MVVIIHRNSLLCVPFYAERKWETLLSAQVSYKNEIPHTKCNTIKFLNIEHCICLLFSDFCYLEINSYKITDVVDLKNIGLSD